MSKDFFLENTMILGQKLEYLNYLVYFNLKSVVLKVLKSHFVPPKFLNS